MGARIWLDGDACPHMVREIVYKAVLRVRVPLVLVSNRYQRMPANPLFRLEVVGSGFDAADHFILREVCKGDLVVTADIPFSDQLVQKGAMVVTPTGEELDERNIKDKLATRNLMSELRGGLLIRGGGSSPGGREKRAFADAFDRLLTRLVKN